MSAILLAMFLLGAFAALVQVIFAREAMVAFMGNELTIGAIFGAWLLDISLGAWTAKRLAQRISAPVVMRTTICLILSTMTVSLPLQVLAIRATRIILGLTMGEYVPFGQMFFAILLVFLPTCFGIGLLFPLISRLIVMEKRIEDSSPETGGRALGGMYAWEAAGSMVGGILVTFIIVPLLSPLRMVALACAPILLAMAIIEFRKATRVSRAALSLIMCFAAILPGVLKSADRFADEIRWRAFGVLSASSADRSRLVATRDSIYQNLAVIKTDDQYALYADGRIQSSYPAVADAEFRVHFIMAQKPAAHSVLLVGGNWAADIPELLKYPAVRNIVHVETDPAAIEIMRPFVASITNDTSRCSVRFETGDAWRYVMSCKEKFDVVLLNAPAPTTAAANRYYTLEFNRGIASLLSAGGFMHTGISVSERMQTRAVDYGAAVYRVLTEVFPIVLVTAGENAHFLAGTPDSGLTFDPVELRRRSETVAPPARFFRPEFFEADDSIDPVNTGAVVSKLKQKEAPLNTIFRPTTFLLNLTLMCSMTGTFAEDILSQAAAAKTGTLTAMPVIAGLLCLAAGFLMRRKTGAGSENMQRWLRGMVATAALAIGFSGMALYILVIFAFQGLFGYVYAKIGLISAAVMLGLVCGGRHGGKLAGDRSLGMLSLLVVTGLLAAIFPLIVWAFIKFAAVRAACASVQWPVELALYLIATATGWLVGVFFAPANRLYCETGTSISRSAAVIGACDHAGAAAGSIAAGVLLLPIAGIDGTLLFISALNAAAILCLLSNARK